MWLVLLSALFMLFPAVCRAEASADSARDAGPSPSLWKSSWPTFSWTEGIATVSAGTVTGVLALREQPQQARWSGGILFDDAVRRGLRLSSAEARHRARRVGDFGYYAAPLLPLIVDPLFVALAGQGDGKLALNLELMGLEAFSYAGVLSFVSTRLSVRERPDATECRRQHADGVGCEHDTEAFWSGHTSIAAASAGLVCANHRYMRLWGSSWADASACALASTTALVTGVTRLAADRHYATDVIVGLGVGFGMGYAVPVLLHYTRKKSNLVVAVQPEPYGAGASLSLAGAF